MVLIGKLVELGRVEILGVLQKWIKMANLLTRNPNKRQTGPYGHIGGSMSYMPKFIHYCPLIVTNNYFHSTQTIVDSRGLQS